jgi:predicted permease
MKHFRRLFRFTARTTADVHAEVAEELQFHLEMRARDLIAEGVPPTEAKRRAMQEFGDVAAAAAQLNKDGAHLERRRSIGRFFTELRQDSAYALRVLSRNRRFAATAVLTLGVAIGGNTAIFSVVNVLFFQPLAIRAPQDVVRIYTGESTISWANADDIRRRNAVLSDVFVQSQYSVSLPGDPLPVVVRAGLVSMNYFSALGAPPLVGRTLRSDDAAADVAVLSERLWRSRFGAAESIIGTTISIDGRPREVIGVMPAAFRGIAPPALGPQLWIPVDVSGIHRALVADRGATRFEAYGRLGSGVSAGQAEAALRVLGNQLAHEFPATDARFTATEVFPASGIGLYRGVGKALLPVFTFVGFLAVIAGFILFISCANLAGLLLARATARRQEIAVRLALGAGRGRLIRQLLTESVILALMAGAAGLAIATVLASGISRMISGLPFPVELDLTVDRRVLVYALCVSTVSAILFGLSPARRASRISVVDSLKGQHDGGGARQLFRQGLIIAQVSVSTLLLFWAGLFGLSLLHAGKVDPGFDPAGVLLAQVPLVSDGQAATAGSSDAWLEELQDRVREFPGVQSAGWASIVPLALLGNERFRISRAEGDTGEEPMWIVASRLSPGWFSTVRIPLIAGRDFTWQDRQGAPEVAIVNETLARRLWDGAAIGRRFRHGDRIAEVVGVAGDTKYWTLGEVTQPEVYLPARQVIGAHVLTLHVRTTDLRGTAERLRAAVQELRPGAPASMTPMDEAVAVALLPARTGALATGAFGLLGACLATLGVYGLISYLIVQRSREIAIRRALGASTAHLIRILVRSSIVLSAIGLIVGIALGSASAPLLGGLLVGVSPIDPLAAGGTALIVFGAAALASIPRALQGSRVDPLESLRGL